MTERRECPNDIGAFRMVRTGVPVRARLGGAHFDLDINWSRCVQQTSSNQRQERQIARRGITAHAADVIRSRDFGAVKLRESIDKLT